MAKSTKITNQNGRPAVTIVVDGIEMRPRDAMFVFYNPEGVPAAHMPSDSTKLDHLTRAARSHWYSTDAALLALNEGWRVEIMSTVRFLKEIAPLLANQD